MRQKRSQLKIGVILNYANMILGNLIPIFYTPIMLALLGQEEYGLYKLSSSVTSYLSLISFGIGSAVTRYLIKAEQEEGKEAEERTLGLFMVIFQVIAALAFVVGTVLTLNLDVFYGNSLSAEELERMKLLVFLMVCNMALSFSQSPYVSVVTAHERFVFLQCINIVTTCIGPLLNLVMLMLGFASVGMTISSLMLTLICRLAYMLYVHRILDMKPRYHDMPTHAFREILTFSFWIFVSNVGSQLCNTTDVAMIGAIPSLATSGVAIYNIGATFNNIVSSLTAGISSALSPRTTKLVFSGADTSTLTDVAIKVGRIQALIVFLVISGFISFGQSFLLLYVGDGYEESYWIAVLMMIPSSIPLIQSMCLSIIVAMGKHRFRSIVCLIITVMNVVGTWVLLHIWGVVGAAAMTGIALLLGNGLTLNWYYSKRIKLDILRFWKEILVFLPIPCAFCLGVYFTGYLVNFDQPIILLLGIIVYTGIYAVLNYQFVMNDYEKDLIRKPILTILARLNRT